MGSPPKLLTDKAREVVGRSVNEFIAAMARYADVEGGQDEAMAESLTLFMNLAVDGPATDEDRAGVSLVCAWSAVLELMVEFPDDEE